MKKILIVDDATSIRQMASLALTTDGFDVVEAVDGEDAVTKARSQKFDLIISDVNMPKKNGYELLAELRSDSTYKHIPMLLLTTESSAESKSKGKEAGATGWIVKPFNPESFLKVVKKVLGL